ncbi:MAG TPA: hypothetical protein EYG97_03330 [Arcobacter sp.]|nr:hypothetical protein [Arcobacter sp.]HIP56033.1 hypothetical protein [Arcobacter sp.]
MKKIILLILSSVYLFANTTNEYYVKYNDYTIGKITNFDTIEKGYLVAKPTGFLFSSLFPFENYIIYENGKQPKLKQKNKYKKDKYFLLDLVRQLSTARPKYKTYEKDNFSIQIKCDNSRCTYTRYDKKQNKFYDGYLTFTNKTLDKIYDSESTISFERIINEKLDIISLI